MSICSRQEILADFGRVTRLQRINVIHKPTPTSHQPIKSSHPTRSEGRTQPGHSHDEKKQQALGCASQTRRRTCTRAGQEARTRRGYRQVSHLISPKHSLGVRRFAKQNSGAVIPRRCRGTLHIQDQPSTYHLKKGGQPREGHEETRSPGWSSHTLRTFTGAG